jgi:hypothetical protein
MTTIGYRAFSRTGLTSITIPGNVFKIECSAFQGTALTSITVAADNSHYSFEDGALFNKDKTVLLRYLPSRQSASYTIPGSVKTIKDQAFGGFAGLTSIMVAIDNAHYSSIDGVLFNKDKTVLIRYPAGKQGAYTIPDGVKTIGSGAFSGCGRLTSVTIPNSVTSIEEFAFSFCTGLTSITIPNSIISIGSSAFWYCTNLIFITIPSSVMSIESSAFGGRPSSLKSLIKTMFVCTFR